MPIAKISEEKVNDILHETISELFPSQDLKSENSKKLILKECHKVEIRKVGEIRGSKARSQAEGKSHLFAGGIQG